MHLASRIVGHGALRQLIHFMGVCVERLCIVMRHKSITGKEESVCGNVSNHRTSEPLPQCDTSILLHRVAKAAIHGAVLWLPRWMQLTFKYLNLELCFQKVDGRLCSV